MDRLILPESVKLTKYQDSEEIVFAVQRLDDHTIVTAYGQDFSFDDVEPKQEFLIRDGTVRLVRPLCFP